MTHEPHTIGSMAAHVVTPAIHCVFSNLKTWGLGVYHGLRPKHLKAYLDEFSFQQLDAQALSPGSEPGRTLPQQRQGASGARRQPGLDPAAWTKLGDVAERNLRL